MSVPRDVQRSPNETMPSISAMKSAYYDIAKRLNVLRNHVRFATTPQHDGSPHIESDGNGFAYIVTDRGAEYERRWTASADDILYWLVSDLTREMASQYELSHRVPNADSRRMIFRKHLELLGDINRDWLNGKRSEDDAVLKQHPYHDRMGEPSDARESPS